MSVPDAVIELVERFKRNEVAYHSGQYNETQVRREFIDPFFECLGWDVVSDYFNSNSHTIQRTHRFSLQNSAFILFRATTDRQIDQLGYGLYGLTEVSQGHEKNITMFEI